MMIAAHTSAVMVTLIYCQHELVSKRILITINLRAVFLPNNLLRDEPRLQPLLAMVRSRAIIPTLTSCYCQSVFLINASCFGVSNLPGAPVSFSWNVLLRPVMIISYVSAHFKRERGNG